LEYLGLHNKSKAEVHPGHKLTGPKEEKEEEEEITFFPSMSGLTSARFKHFENRGSTLLRNTGTLAYYTVSKLKIRQPTDQKTAMKT